MHISLYFSVLFLGMAASRTHTLMARGGFEQKSLPLAIVSGLSMLATFGIIILGFFLYSWWVPLVSFAMISILMAVLITRVTLGVFHIIEPVTGIGTLVLCAYGWYAWAMH